MRILLTADPFLPVPPTLYGGIERVIALLLAAYRERGHQVGLVAHRDSEAGADQHFDWPISHPEGRLAHFKNGRFLARAIKQFQPQVIHSYSRLAYLMLATGRKTPALMCYQREPTGRTVSLARRWLGEGLEFSGCSGYIAARGQPAGGVWHAVHNCVDTARFQWTESVADDAPLVFLSRVESIKGAHLAIDMARQAGRSLLIAGNHADEGEERDYFEQKVRPELDSRIEYVGPVNDHQKQLLLTSAAAMVVPIQWNEPFGIVFAESLACGTPVITSPRGATPEIIEDGQHGFLVEGLTAGVEAIAKLPQVSRAACRQRAETAFDTRVIADQYLSILTELSRR